MKNIFLIISIILLMLLALTGLYHIIDVYTKEEHIYLLYNKTDNGNCGDLNTDVVFIRTDRPIDGRDIAYTDLSKSFCNASKEIKRVH